MFNLLVNIDVCKWKHIASLRDIQELAEKAEADIKTARKLISEIKKVRKNAKRQEMSFNSLAHTFVFLCVTKKA